MAYVTIKRSEHGASGYTPTQNLAFAQNIPFANIVWEEIPNISQHLPVAFRLIETDGKKFLELVAIQSLDTERNLMVLPNGRWLGGYMPAIYRSEPFAILPDSENPKSLQLNIKEEFIIDAEEEGAIAFFEDNGELSKPLSHAMKFLGEFTKGHRKTQAMIMSLQKHGILRHWDLAKELGLDEASPFTRLPNNLFRADLNKINTLPDEVIGDLQRSGALHLASLQYSSQFRLKGLMSLTRIYDEMLEKVNSTEEQPNIDKLFGEGDDVFSF